MEMHQRSSGRKKLSWTTGNAPIVSYVSFMFLPLLEESIPFSHFNAFCKVYHPSASFCLPILDIKLLTFKKSVLTKMYYDECCLDLGFSIFIFISKYVLHLQIKVAPTYLTYSYGIIQNLRACTHLFKLYLPGNFLRSSLYCCTGVSRRLKHS